MSELNHYGQSLGPSLPEWKLRERPSKKVLHGKYCRLEPIALTHSQQLFDAWHSIDDERDWTYFAINRPITLRQCEHFITSLANSSDPLFFAVVSQLTEKAMGFVALQRIDPEHGAVEIGWINWTPQMKRTPSSTEAIALLLSYIFDTLEYRRCAWKCDSFHETAIKAAERLGFQYEGTFRQIQVSKGHSRDTRWYSILDKEWSTLRNAMNLWLSPANIDERGRQKQRLGDFMPAQISADS
ncbi:GNAT family N-acetyltransferase [Rahnella sp. RcJ3]|uniref:GNAT family N-acetyltransferase n=1 Tax=Rahnella sp. RcJ3 TaxID=2292446 RepID=UPI0012949267|nr:GNAT family protein [Rahnella sp. RcJ3]MQB55866.1 N-acetyltransferase [Rahnella sp. RcJ3]